jgi:hypothetical protein
MSNNVLWAGPRLLVPVTVEALVVTSASNATQFSIQALRLNQYNRFGVISPQPFVSSGKPAQGVYLNWALPDGLTQGNKKEGMNTVDYPFLPNRWMIVRFSADNTVPRAAWIVESDYWFGANEQPTDNRVVNSMFINADKNGDPQISIIGKAYDFATWKENGQNDELFLNAVGNSDPIFTAYAGNNQFVFGFTDSYSNTNAVEMSYMVCGWYSNAKYDPLYTDLQAGTSGWESKQDWLDLMTRLRWSVGSEAIDDNIDLDNAATAAANWLAANNITPLPGLLGTLCVQLLCHGLVFDVQWPGDNVQPPSNVPVFDTTDKSVPYVAAGNTATDCMAAFMQWQLNYNNPNPHSPGQDGDVELLLEAFSHKMLPQPGGILDTPGLMNTIHNGWFGKLPGGTVWMAQAQQANGPNNINATQRPNANAPVSLSPQQAAALAALNNSQAQFDADCRTLVSMQTQLYADWMKANLVPASAPIKTELANTLAAINKLITQLTADETATTTAKNSLVVSLANANLQLINKPSDNFFTANDPVFLVNNVKRSYKRGEDIVYSQDDRFLFVRFTGQFINSLKVNTGSSEVVVQGSSICPQFTITNQVPKEIPALLIEACLMDTTFAAAIAKQATGQSNPPQNIIDTIKQQQTLIWNAALDSSLDQRTLEQIPGFNPGDTTFHVPSKIGVWQWQQPWNPLYLEWEINFYQAIDQTLSKWTFDGSDYNWSGAVVPVNNQNQYTLKGRSLLTPATAVTLQSQLTEFINAYTSQSLPPEYLPLKDVVNGVGAWDVLSQTLKGLTMKLLQWDIQQFGYTPTNSTYAQPLEYTPANPNQMQTVGHGMPVILDGTPFYPVRAGFVQITQLWVVDDFGQVYNLNPANDYASAGVPNPMPPIPGIGVTPSNYTLNLQLPPYFQLPPRVIQGSRLNFKFVSANKDSVPSNQDVTTTPVCGWLLPNHIDKSVSIYDNTGNILGEIALMGATGAQHAQWLPAPLSGVPVANIANAHLKGFVNGLLGNAGSGQALQNFMTAIDETLWSVDPLGERDNQNLSILIGRPIAVIRASLQLELYGNPATDLTIAKTGQNVNGGIGNYTFQAQIGNIDLSQDGVMGYFNGDDYGEFNSVHYGEITTPLNPPYVVNKFTPLQFLAEEPSYITLLLDPRGSIHTSTGILPVLETELPDIYVGDVMNNMLLEFKTGPLIIDDKAWQVSLPAGAGLKWSWLQPAQVDQQLAWTEVTGLVNQTAAVQLPINSPTMREGRLKLAGALGSQPSIYFFQVNGYKEPYNVPVGSTIQLSWAAQGSAATLKVGSTAATSVPLNSAGYPVTVADKQDITLSLLDAYGTIAQSAHITINTASK